MRVVDGANDVLVAGEGAGGLVEEPCPSLLGVREQSRRLMPKAGATYRFLYYSKRRRSGSKCQWFRHFLQSNERPISIGTGSSRTTSLKIGGVGWRTPAKYSQISPLPYNVVDALDPRWVRGLCSALVVPGRAG